MRIKDGEVEHEEEVKMKKRKRRSYGKRKENK